MGKEEWQEEKGPLPRTSEAVDWWLKKWGRTEPLTREDIERLIEVNGDTAKELNLGGRDMRGADLISANLQGADLYEADLQGASLAGAKLQGADLSWANLQGADLRDANLQGAELQGVKISPATNLEGVKWDPKYINVLERKGEYEAAEAVYRRLKEWYRGAGMQTIAGEFHYREMEAKSKAGWRQSWREIKQFGRGFGQLWTEFKQLGADFRQLGRGFKEFKQQLAVAWKRLKGEEGSTHLKE